ncbi:hypothetical protein K440DRAFT_5911 [Wilcoxina mikolae CBS 423.85]|nr:hypothetical protein K440DRAFT_5911 [Wilcoxina mikolae CBS 423.85]
MTLTRPTHWLELQVGLFCSHSLHPKSFNLGDHIKGHSLAFSWVLGWYVLLSWTSFRAARSTFQDQI